MGKVEILMWLVIAVVICLTVVVMFDSRHDHRKVLRQQKEIERLKRQLHDLLDREDSVNQWRCGAKDRQQS